MALLSTIFSRDLRTQNDYHLSLNPGPMPLVILNRKLQTVCWLRCRQADLESLRKLPKLLHFWHLQQRDILMV